MLVLRELRIKSAMLRFVFVTSLMFALSASGIAQPCNPAIDGTYCATLSKNNQFITKSPTNSSQSYGGAFSSLADHQPATLGAVTFRGDGTRCMGLLRRGSCN